MKNHLRALVALMVVVSTFGGAFAAAPHVGGPLGEAVDSANPTGEADALIVGVCTIQSFFGGSSCGPSAEEELAMADSNETHSEIHANWAGLQQASENLLVSYNNRLQDTETIAQMEGKNRYIRALENGTAEATARAEAKGEVEDYYATLELNLINQWRTVHEQWMHYNSTISSDPNLPTREIALYIDTSGAYYRNDGGSAISDGGTTTYTLVNGTTIDVPQIGFTSGGGDTVYVGPSQPTPGGTDAARFGIAHYDSTNYGTVFFNQTKLYNQLGAIDSQRTSVNNEVDTFVDNTYSSYQQGEINASNLVDPYLASRDYSPDDEFGTWALRSLTSMGLAPPDDLSQIGDMNIAYDGQEYNGILLSDGLPDSGSFEVGQTYNTANLTGSQFIMDPYSENLVDMEGEFTLQNATTMHGETLGTVNYTQTNYQTSNTEDYQALMQQLNNLTESINDRQDNLRDGETGPVFSLPDFGFGGAISGFVGILVIVGIIVLAAGRRN